MLKFFFLSQLLLFCNCLQDGNLPSTVKPVDFNAELANIWKELASVKGQLRTATQERNSLQKQLNVANNEISVLKQETSQCRKDVNEIRRNQIEFLEEVKLINGSTTGRNETVDFTTKISDIGQQQNTMKYIPDNTTIQMDSLVSDTSNTSDMKTIQSQFRYLSTELNSLQKSIHNLEFKVDDTSASILVLNLTFKHLQDSTRMVENNTAAIADIRGGMTRCKKTMSGIQQQDISLANKVAHLNTTVQQQVGLMTKFSSSLSKNTQQLSALQNVLTWQDRAITGLRESETRLTDSIGMINATTQKQLASTSNFASLPSKVTQELSNLQNTVAFSAYSDSKSLKYLSSFRTLIFEKTTLNIGQGYHVSTGVFICPVSGYYVFIWTLQTKENHKLDSKLVKNGEASYRFLNIYADRRDYASESNTEVMHLDKGDTVYIQGRGHFYGNWVSSFNGWKFN